ncbi:hypothetical protein J3459_009715 [Metarhizium acridum]|uniref:uncharacterized protein n=1 Tax=Metarhizium acridum TaxID=92637 RepID=UPI001C6C3898|nr:hypothetical protein J3458_008972 [Metarhizium acridum]KAG8425750.1 hypothetical protein J3459_009715 [Metarhizium acridum]
MLLSIVHDREVLCDEPPPGAEKCTRIMDWRPSRIEHRTETGHLRRRAVIVSFLLQRVEQNASEMADISSPISRRVSSPAADGLYVPTPMLHEPSRRTPSPKLAYSDRRSCQHIRRSSLEPVLEGEVRTPDNRRQNVGHDPGSALPKPNLAKPRAPNSGRPAHSKSIGLRRDLILRSESLLSVEVKTNVVVCIAVFRRQTVQC